MDFRATVRPARFEPGTEITRVTADLSALGGPAAAPLVDAGDGTYRLEGNPFLVESPRGRRTISVMIDQRTRLGPYWTRLLGTLTVLPAEDLALFADALNQDWQLTPALKVETDPDATAQIYEGSRALALRTDGNW
ncbi:MAG: hypothetical protein ABIJ95_12695, partial [Pseudomonadota bacterium]